MRIETLLSIKDNWKPISVHLANGSILRVNHPDFLFIVPNQTAVLIFLEPEGNRFHIVYREQIVSIERDV